MRKIINILILLALPAQLWSATTWNQKANFGGPARHRATGFSIGNKGYLGLGHTNSGEHIVKKDFWEYDPSTNSWTQKADFGGGERYQCAAFSIHGIGYVGTGRSHPLDVYEKDFWAFNPNANMWFPIADLPGVERRGAAAFTIEGKGYVGLGQTEGGYASDFYEYNPETDTWTQVADFIGAPRTSAVSFVYNKKAYVGTGHTWGAALKDFYEFNPSSNYWTQKMDVGDSLRQDATGFVLNGKGYLGTGNNVDGSINYKDFWRYDFDLNTWTQIEDFRGAARRYMVSFVVGNTAYCGTGTNGTNLRDFWAFDPILSDESNVWTDGIDVYPNPAKNNINFSFNENLKVNFSALIIYDISGKMVYQSDINTPNLTVDLMNLESGMYAYELVSSEQKMTNGKFIITK